MGFLLVIGLFRSRLLPFSPLALILLLVLVVRVAQRIDNLWLRPQLMDRSLHLHPGLVFGGLTGALMVGGFLAAFFVVPLMGTAKVLGRYIICQLFDLPPRPDPPIEVNDADVFNSDSAQPHKPVRWPSQQQQDGLSGQNMLPKS
jgi:predicted PurR-regulated permease PerM